MKSNLGNFNKFKIIILAGGYGTRLKSALGETPKVLAPINKKPFIEISLKYNSGNPVINTIERVSKPGRRIFSSASSLPKINNGLGIAIVSTPQGVMTDVDARKKKLGGEIICKVF